MPTGDRHAGRHGLRPETFEFLGFRHVCGVDRSGRFALVRIPSTKSCRKFLARIREWLLAHRHWKRREQQQHLTLMLRGFYQYFALHHCGRKLTWIRQEVLRQWKHAMQRRGQRRRLSWKRLANCSWFELPFAPAHRNGSPAISPRQRTRRAARSPPPTVLARGKCHRLWAVGRTAHAVR